MTYQGGPITCQGGPFLVRETFWSGQALKSQTLQGWCNGNGTLQFIRSSSLISTQFIIFTKHSIIQGGHQGILEQAPTKQMKILPIFYDKGIFIVPKFYKVLRMSKRAFLVQFASFQTNKDRYFSKKLNGNENRVKKLKKYPKLCKLLLDLISHK